MASVLHDLDETLLFASFSLKFWPFLLGTIVRRIPSFFISLS